MAGYRNGDATLYDARPSIYACPVCGDWGLACNHGWGVPEDRLTVAQRAKMWLADLLRALASRIELSI